MHHTWVKALARPTTAVGAILVVGWIIVALLSGMLAPYDPLHSMQPLALPGAHGPGGETFWLGTDSLGRDILSRLIFGARTVVIVATMATLSAYAVGVTSGLVVGFFQGWVVVG